VRQGGAETRYTYDAWGQLALQMGALQNDFLYTARERRLDGQYYYRWRDYHPGIGRFVGQDPMPIQDREFLEVNSYAYVSNDPIYLTDPLGLGLTCFGNYCGNETYCGAFKKCRDFEFNKNGEPKCPTPRKGPRGCVDRACYQHDQCYYCLKSKWCTPNRNERCKKNVTTIYVAMFINALAD
jgi:RHS repeat-associated protein